MREQAAGCLSVYETGSARRGTTPDAASVCRPPPSSAARPSSSSGISPDREPGLQANDAATIVVRPARQDDVERVLRMWRMAAREPTDTDDVPGIRRLLERDDAALLLAERGGDVVGSIIAGWDGWRGNLYRLAVAPEMRLRGVARALVMEAEQRLRARGARKIHLGALRRHGDAVALWRALGYRRDGRIDRYAKTLEP
jgi:ribosomal protein S18 acetylase RimI-like enzyme